jgi:hypothetical protein
MHRAFERGIELRSKAVDSDSQRVIIGFVDCELGNWRDAYAILRAAGDSSDEDQRLALGIAAAHVGDTATVRATLDWIDTWRRRDPAIRGRDTMTRAFVVLAQGHRAEALALLRQSIGEGMAPTFQSWLSRYELASLRGDPAFEALVRERK